jgi:hypothetical protein
MVNVQTLHRRAARVLPEVIKTSGVLLEDAGQNELAAMLFPLRRKSTGAVLFRISMETVHAMGERPLAYLKEAMRAREGLGRRREPFVYNEWRVARVPEGWISMILQPRSRFPTQFIDVFFTTKTDGKAWVVVVPDKWLAAYLWCD